MGFFIPSAEWRFGSNYAPDVILEFILRSTAFGLQFLCGVQVWCSVWYGVWSKVNGMVWYCMVYCMIVYAMVYGMMW